MRYLAFTPSTDTSQWWAIDDDLVEFCIYPMSDVGWDSEMWQCFAQKRVAFNEVKEGIGVYESFEEAVQACEDYDTTSLLDCFR